MNNLHGTGLRFIEDVNMCEAGEPVTVKRSIFERLFTRPWRPLLATRVVVPRVPMKKVYKMENGTIIGHPVTVRELQRQLKGE